MNKVEESFKNRAFRTRGGEGLYLYSKSDALQFIEACKKENVKILGLDGFFLFGEKVQPSIENSVDYSSIIHTHQPKDIYSAALKFLETKDEKLFFEIVCANQPIR
ncbi:MAG: hypothetical protein AAB592_02480 [Patescibacteria group bacterium]